MGDAVDGGDGLGAGEAAGAAGDGDGDVGIVGGFDVAERVGDIDDDAVQRRAGGCPDRFGGEDEFEVAAGVMVNAVELNPLRPSVESEAESS